MTYQSIIDILRTTANTVNPTGIFINARRTDGSLEYSNQFPQIHLYPLRETIDINAGNITAEVLLMFWKQDSPDSTNDERETIIADMDVLSTAYLVELNTNMISISNARKTPEFRQLAGTVSGYGLAFTLSGKIGCDTPQ
jgi:hypothetical protein